MEFWQQVLTEYARAVAQLRQWQRVQEAAFPELRSALVCELAKTVDDLTTLHLAFPAELPAPEVPELPPIPAAAEVPELPDVLDWPGPAELPGHGKENDGGSTGVVVKGDQP